MHFSAEIILHIQENQEVSPSQEGDHKAARNKQDSMTDKKIKLDF